MKTTIKSILMPAFCFFAPVAMGSIYEGSWKNKTFGSTGALTIDITVRNSVASGNFNLDGSVFGGGDPPKIPFRFPLKADGSGTIKIIDTALGDFNGSIGDDGKFSLTITDLPNVAVTEVRINGKFDLKAEVFDVKYEVDDEEGTFANGTAEAHVRKPPAVEVVTVRVAGGTGKAVVKVVSNTRIKSVNVNVLGPPRPRLSANVTGDNPYQINVTNLPVGLTQVRFTVTNSDRLPTSKIVNFVRRR